MSGAAATTTTWTAARPGDWPKHGWERRLGAMLLGCVAAVGWWYWQAAFQSDVLQLHIPEQSDHDSCAGQKVIGFPQESVIGFGQEPVIGITQE